MRFNIAIPDLFVKIFYQADASNNTNQYAADIERSLLLVHFDVRKFIGVRHDHRC